MNRLPQLRHDLVIVEQRYRGEQSYIVKDPDTFKYYRFKPLEILIMQQLNGEFAVSDLATGLAAQGLPVPETALRGFVERLGRMGLLERSLAEKSTLRMERVRAERHRRLKRTHYQGSLLRMRWSVGDPDHFFERLMPHFRFCFTPVFLAISVGLFLTYGFIFVTRWPDIASGIVAMYSLEMFTLQNIALFWGTAMVVIVIHELGHGFACKYFGGQVYEMGAMLIYFQPAFYCNVNDAWTFPKLSHRLWVTAAGSWIQLVVAALAAILWVIVDPDTVIARVAFFAVLVGGATTVLANANPLIPLDGYYALSDWLEIPNLRQRALGYLGWLIKRHVLRLSVPEFEADERERRVFLIYGGLAITYIVTILSIVALLVLGWLSGLLGALGVLLFVLMLWAMLRVKLREWGRAVGNAVREHRDALTDRRRLLRAGGATAAVLLVLLFLPWPLRVDGAFTVTPGHVVALTAADSGVLAEVYVGEGGRVEAGAALARLRNTSLVRSLAVLRRLDDSLAVRGTAARANGRWEAARVADLRRREVAVRHAGLAEQVDRLVLRAPVSGTVLTARLDEHVGRAYGGGEVVAELAGGAPLALTRLDRAGAGRVAPGQTVRLVFPGGTGRAMSGEVVDVLPATRDPEAVELRVAFADPALVPPLGVTGTAYVTVGRSNLLGAVWWAVRKRIRNDLLL